jgi:CBS domain-containing protein
MDSLLVRDIMQHKIVTVSTGDRLSTVEDIMTLGGVRHMPVVSAGELVGVVSERDLLRASLSSLSEDYASDHRRAFLHAVEIASVMSSPPITIGPESEIRDAARTMAERKIGCLPVVEPPGKLIGLVTETDLLRYFAGLDREL